MAQNIKLNLLFLLIDDSEGYAESLKMNVTLVNQEDAQALPIQLRWVSNLDAAKALMDEPIGHSVAAVILDVNCLKGENDTADSSFIAAAATYFAEKAPHLPKAIITGEQGLYPNIKMLFEGTMPVYTKSQDEHAMLRLLRERALKLPRTQLIREYQDAFAIAQRYFVPQAYEELAFALGKAFSPGAIIGGTHNSLRKVLESMLITLSKIDPEMIPRRCIVNPLTGETKVDFKEILRQLTGNWDNALRQSTSTVYLHNESRLKYQMQFIYGQGSVGSHFKREEDTLQPNLYTVRMLAYALLDLILWFGGVCEQKTAKETDSLAALAGLPKA